MNLTCSTALLALAVCTLACHESTAPHGTTRVYVLDNINGNPPPAITSAGAGDTLTVLWATLTLGPDGNAVTIDRFRHAYLAYPPQESTRSWRYQYRVAGDSITVGYFGKCPDICISNQVGVIADSSVSLIESYNPYPVPSVIRRYHLINTY